MAAAFSSLLEGIANVFGGKPNVSNDTLRQIEERLASKAEAERAKEERAVYKRQAEEQLAVYKRQAEEQLANSKRQAEQQFAASRRQAEEQVEEELAVLKRKAKAEAARGAFQEEEAEEELAVSKRKAKAERAARLKAESARLAFEQHAEQLQAELAASKRRAEEQCAAFKRQAEAELAARLNAEKDRVVSQQREHAAVKAADDAKIALRRGIRPVEWPSKKQYDAAMKRIEYNPEKLHIAVCGLSGSGKSSLVNAFRGLRVQESDSAKVGVTETTSEIGRYPDAREDYPFSRFVWYDIPGAGTVSVRDWQYFNDQGLFVFDFLIVVYDARFTSIDAGIMENCNRFGIPVFIVRSKADQHISNMVSEEGDGFEPGDAGYEKVYREKMVEFVSTTRENFREEKEKMNASKEREVELEKCDSKNVIESHFHSSYQEWLSKQIVYIVSAKNVRNQVLASLSRDPKQFTDSKIMIDEVELLKGLLSTATLRLYSGSDSKGNETLSK